MATLLGSEAWGIECVDFKMSYFVFLKHNLVYRYINYENKLKVGGFTENWDCSVLRSLHASESASGYVLCFTV